MMIVNPYVFAGEPAPFSPADISDLSGWWDPSDTLTVTESGGVISAIAAQADAAYSGALEQSDAGLRPSTTTINGIGAVSCAGDCLVAGGFPSLLAVDFTMAIVLVRPIAASMTNRTFVAVGNSGTVAQCGMAVKSPDDGQININFNDGSTATNTGTTTELDIDDGNPHVLIARRTGGTIDLIDETGLVVATNSLPDPADAVATARFSYGCWFASGHPNFQAFAGDLGEALLYRKAVSGTELSDLVTYLAGKWIP